MNLLAAQKDVSRSHMSEAMLSAGQTAMVCTDVVADSTGCASNCSATIEGIDDGRYEVTVVAAYGVGKTIDGLPSRTAEGPSFGESAAPLAFSTDASAPGCNRPAPPPSPSPPPSPPPSPSPPPAQGQDLPAPQAFKCCPQCAAGPFTRAGETRLSAEVQFTLKPTGRTITSFQVLATRTKKPPFARREGTAARLAQSKVVSFVADPVSSDDELKDETLAATVVPSADGCATPCSHVFRGIPHGEYQFAVIAMTADGQTGTGVSGLRDSFMLSCPKVQSPAPPPPFSPPPNAPPPPHRPPEVTPEEPSATRSTTTSAAPTRR